MQIAAAFAFLTLAYVASAYPQPLAGLSGPSFGAALPAPPPKRLNKQPQQKPAAENSAEEYDVQSEQERLRDLIAQAILKHGKPNQQQETSYEEPKQQAKVVQEPNRNPIQSGNILESLRPQVNSRPVQVPRPLPLPIRDNEQFAALFQHQRPSRPHAMGSLLAQQVESELQLEPEPVPQSILKPMPIYPNGISKPSLKPAGELESEAIRKPWYQSLLLGLRQQESQAKELPEEDIEEKQVQEQETIDIGSEAESAVGQESVYLNSFAQPSPYFVVPNFHQ